MRLIGVLIILIGFYKKYNPIAVVLVAGITTGLVSGIEIVTILDILGKTFVTNRYMSIFLLTLPVIGILERYGLKERSVMLIKSMKSATTGRVIIIYTFFREMASVFGLRLGGHVQFVRPLVYPMAYGAAEKNYQSVSEDADEKIKGISAAAENYGNFYGQNVFPASGGVLLVVGTLAALEIEVIPMEVAIAAIPVAVIAFIYTVVQSVMFDGKLNQTLQKNKIEKGA
ncbi:MAG: DUF969 domain-containing protein [Eubacteriales bacterium]|nr:DUF969 domain-containing protein [Eubacteriales bacterium]